MAKTETTTASPKARNTDPSPMEHVSIRLPNRNMERAALARDAEGMLAADLRAEAERLQIPLGGAKSKEDLVAAVQSAVIPT